MLKKYCFGIVSPIFALIFFVYVNFFCFDPLYTPAEYWIQDMYNLKDLYFRRSISGKKIIIISGSNSLFGVNSNIVSMKTKTQVLNLAVHAGLPLKFLVQKTLSYVSPGDLVVLPLEYVYYRGSETINDWQKTQFSTWGARLGGNAFESEQLVRFWLNIPSLYVHRIYNKGQAKILVSAW